jgi:hypothetical protein
MIVDGGQDKIRLKTNDGKTGYRIVKFQIMPFQTGSGANEAIMSVFKVKQGSAPQNIDFTDGDLLGVAFFLRDQGVVAITSDTVIFDNEIFNQDIFINYEDAQTSQGMNYYLELEQIILNDNQTTMATLQSLRQIAEK